MGKSRNKKWYDDFNDDEDYDDKSKKKKFINRRNEKRMKNAIKTKDLSYLMTQDDE